MKASVYTSLFNYSPDKFDLLGAFKNWSKYADEIVIATFEDQFRELFLVLLQDEFFEFRSKLRLIFEKDTSLDDPLFDGKLKNAALQNCSNELVIQQDMDERIGGDPEQWEYLAKSFEDFNYPITCAVPVIDLYKDYEHYKSVGFKFYFHKKEGIRRGVVNYAKRDDGTIDISKSDTTEPIDQNGNLVPYFADLRFKETFDIKHVHIIHLGFLDLKKRVENNKFWKPHWKNRCGEEVDIATSIEELENKNEYFPHNLNPQWWT